MPFPGLQILLIVLTLAAAVAAAAGAAVAFVAVRRLSVRLDRLTAGVDMHFKTERKWRKTLAQQTAAILRHAVLPAHDATPTARLLAKRFKLYSQNEEDGILLALIEAAGAPARRFVEIGSGMTGGNSALLAMEFGWSGLMVEARRGHVEEARRRFSHNPGVQVVRAMATPTNVNKLLAKHGAGDDIDVLSLDIDSDDYWVLRAFNICRPRIIVVEYNALFGPKKALTVARGVAAQAGVKGYSGASLMAFDRLLTGRDYRLVAVEPNGVNAFFLRNDLAPEVPRVPVAQAFRAVRLRAETDDVERDIDIFEVAASRHLPLVEV